MFTKEQLQDMARCREMVCEDCRAKDICDNVFSKDTHSLATQLLSTMDRLERVEKELLFKDTALAMAKFVRASTAEKAKLDAELLMQSCGVPNKYMKGSATSATAAYIREQRMLHGKTLTDKLLEIEKLENEILHDDSK